MVSGCKNKEEAPPAPAQQAQPAPSAQPAPAAQSGALFIVKFGPESTTAGQVFNAQPSGESALWVTAENIPTKTVIVFNNTNLKSFVGKDGKLITAIVPKNMYEKPGSYPLFLLDTETNAKSNEVVFSVK